MARFCLTRRGSLCCTPPKGRQVSFYWHQTNGGRQDGGCRAADCRDPARCHARSYVAEVAPFGGATNY